MQIAPSPLLADMVRHFLIIETEHIQKLRIFTDGNTGIVFNYGDALIHENPFTNEKALLPDSFLYGQLDQFQHLVSTGKVRLLVVVLHAHSASQLLGIPACELRNNLLDLEFFFRNEAGDIVARLLIASGVTQRCSLIEGFLLNKIKTLSPQKTLAGQAIQLIQYHHGNLPISQLKDKLQVSERKLQRLFEEQIGLAPKRYAGVIRMQRFLKLLRKSAPAEAITTSVYDSGFYDHAHLIREMKQLSGITPRQYLNQKMLAANFFQVSS